MPYNIIPPSLQHAGLRGQSMGRCSMTGRELNKLIDGVLFWVQVGILAVCCLFGGLVVVVAVSIYKVVTS
jgi:hypothetical protein